MIIGFDLKDVSIDIPSYDVDSFSLRHSALKYVDISKEVNILKDINLTIGSGARVGILGDNGSGKTSLLRLLVGSYHPTSGSIQRSGMISSLTDINLGIRPEASGIENIKLKLKCDGYNYKDQDLINRIVEFSELKEHIFLPLKNYSSGMQMRLAFSIATEITPEILILDEWLSVGDSKFKDKAEKRISSLIESTKVFVIASHDENLLKEKCNRIIHMKNGSIDADYLL